MPKYRLYSICPACGNNELFQFSCTCGGNDYIDQDLYITCDKCNKKDFILDSTFKCNVHSDYRKPSFQNVLVMISKFCCLNIIDSVTAEEMIKKVNKYFH